MSPHRVEAVLGASLTPGSFSSSVPCGHVGAKRVPAVIRPGPVSCEWEGEPQLPHTEHLLPHPPQPCPTQHCSRSASSALRPPSLAPGGASCPAVWKCHRPARPDPAGLGLALLRVFPPGASLCRFQFSGTRERVDLGPGDSGPRGRLKEGGVEGDRGSWGPPPMAVDANRALTESLQ